MVIRIGGLKKVAEPDSSDKTSRGTESGPFSATAVNYSDQEKNTLLKNTLRTLAMGGWFWNRI